MPLISTILHVDINSYFATLLQQETPPLRGRPVGVLKDVGRTCIIAASKEAKARGVATGSLVSDARSRCPDIVLVPAQFELYLSATKRLKKLFESFSPEVEIFSLDEAFIHYTPLRRVYQSPEACAQQIQLAIKQTLGEWVTCNIGIAHNRFLAKMSGEVAPKGSITVVTADNQDALLASTPFASVCGIGHRLEKRLRRFGVRVPYQINFIDDETLRAAFGPFWSVELRKMGSGEEPLLLARPSVQRNPHMKSVGRSLTGFGLWRSEAQVRQVLYNLCEEVMYKVRKMNLAGREVGAYLVGSWSQRGRGAAQPLGWGELPQQTPSRSMHQTVSAPIRHTRELFALIDQGLFGQPAEFFPVIKVGVYLSLLKPWDDSPKVLWPEWWQQERVSSALDKITSRYGLFTVKPASLLGHEMIRPEVTGYLGDQKFQLGD